MSLEFGFDRWMGNLYDITRARARQVKIGYAQKFYIMRGRSMGNFEYSQCKGRPKVESWESTPSKRSSNKSSKRLGLRGSSSGIYKKKKIGT